MRALAVAATGVLVIAFAGGAAGRAASRRAADIETYRYAITVAGSGQTLVLQPRTSVGVGYTGSVSGTFSVTYQVAITLDPVAKTIAAHSLNTKVDLSGNPIDLPTGVPHSLSIGGTVSFDVTASCSGPPCEGPSTTCKFSSPDISAYYRTYDARLYMPGVDQRDTAAYASGTFWLQQVVSSTLPNPPAPTPCTGGPGGNGGGQAYSAADAQDIPGFTDGDPAWSNADNRAFPIPLTELGQSLIQKTFTPQGKDCSMDFVDTACTASATVTMKLLPAPKTSEPAWVKTAMSVREAIIANQEAEHKAGLLLADFEFKKTEAALKRTRPQLSQLETKISTIKDVPAPSDEAARSGLADAADELGTALDDDLEVMQESAKADAAVGDAEDNARAKALKLLKAAEYKKLDANDHLADAIRASGY